MSRYNRYKFLKKYYSHFCIVFLDKVNIGIGRIIVNNEDLEISDISYIVIDNLNIVKIFKSSNNKYEKYFYYYGIKKILKVFK